MNKSRLIILLLTVSYATSLFAQEGILISRSDEKIYMDLKIPAKNMKEITKRISSGLTNKVLISVQIKEKKSNRVIVNKNFLYQAVYDVWDEKYILSLFDPQKRFTVSTKDKEEILRLLGNPEKMEICDTGALLPRGAYHIKVKVVLNPVSREIIEKIKEYLSDPELVQRDRTTRTIFGSFANVFIPELNTENVVKFEIRSLNLSDIPLKK